MGNELGNKSPGEIWGMIDLHFRKKRVAAIKEWSGKGKTGGRRASIEAIEN